MKYKETAAAVVHRYGGDILGSQGMLLSQSFRQHGDVSVALHCFFAAVVCVRLARALALRVDTRALVRGALLHDYFLYDWHDPDPSHRLHGFRHAGFALRNAGRDFSLGPIERNMIASHMLPMNLVLPRFRESLLLCLADKICSFCETFHLAPPVGKDGLEQRSKFQ
ncbi:MAG: phosphohydrolase [Clostridia bacterium]|nr:phosphohydrolase [Clostridia bacterium]